MASLFGITLLSLPTAFVGVAQAQTGYPPGTTTTTTPTTGTGGGTVVLGGTIRISASGYAAGSTATVFVDGNAAGSATASATGVLGLSIKAVSATTALVNGVLVPITCGANSVTFTG